METIDLAIRVATESGAAVDGFDAVARAADRADSAVADVAATSEKTGRQLAITAEGADNLATKSSIATGALGALSSGFELVGLEKYATGLQQASMATDFFSGIGDSLTLVMESTALQTARARVATVRHAVATRASAAATRAQAVAQRVLNVAMRANPIGLIITAVLALVAGFVLLYRRSETFRNIVNSVGRAGRAAIGWVIDKVSDLIGWVRDRAPAAFNRMRDIASRAARIVMAPFRALRDLVQDVIGWISRIKLPSLGGIGKALGFGLMARQSTDLAARTLMAAPLAAQPLVSSPTSSGGFGASALLSGLQPVVNDNRVFVEVTGALDADKVAQQIEQLLERRRRRLGLR